MDFKSIGFVGPARNSLISKLVGGKVNTICDVNMTFRWGEYEIVSVNDKVPVVDILIGSDEKDFGNAENCIKLCMTLDISIKSITTACKMEIERIRFIERLRFLQSNETLDYFSETFSRFDSFYHRSIYLCIMHPTKPSPYDIDMFNILMCTSQAEVDAMSFGGIALRCTYNEDKFNGLFKLYFSLLNTAGLEYVGSDNVKISRYLTINSVHALKAYLDLSKEQRKCINLDINYVLPTYYSTRLLLSKCRGLFDRYSHKLLARLMENTESPSLACIMAKRINKMYDNIIDVLLSKSLQKELYGMYLKAYGAYDFPALTENLIALV